MKLHKNSTIIYLNICLLLAVRSTSSFSLSAPINNNIRPIRSRSSGIVVTHQFPDNTAEPYYGKEEEEEKDEEDDEDETDILEKAFTSGLKDKTTAKRRRRSEFIEEEMEDYTLNDDRPESVDIPKGGVSVSETIEDSQRDRFTSTLVPIKILPGVAQIVTTTDERGSFDPVRYIVALQPPKKKEEETDDKTTNDLKTTTISDFVMTDIPPFSQSLAASIRKFMGKGGRLVGILMTSRTSIHYDEGPSVYTARQTHLEDWIAVFPDLKSIVGYRLDVPRDSASRFTQKLNGYGPWAWNDDEKIFEETGQQLIVKEWDTETIKTKLQKGAIPIGEEDEAPVEETKIERDNSPKGIRQREEGKRLLAVYTPGNTFGTLSYVFPETNVVVSAFTIPIEDIEDSNGPSMDTRGYITTSSAGMKKQMESARHLVKNYVDRFGVVLPARADPVFLDQMDPDDRKRLLFAVIEQYDQIGEQYSNVGKEDDDDDDDDDDE